MADKLTGLSRRDFFKVAGGAAAGLVAGRLLPKSENGVDIRTSSEHTEHGRALVTPVSKAEAEYLLKSVKGNEKAWEAPTIITINHDSPIDAAGYANQSYHFDVALPTGEKFNADSFVEDDMGRNGSSADYANNGLFPAADFPISGFSEGANSKTCDLIVDGIRSVWKAEGVKGVNPLGSQDIGTPLYKEYTYFALLPNSDGKVLPPKDEVDNGLNLVIGVAHNRFSNIGGSDGNTKFGNALQGMDEGKEIGQVTYYRVFSK